MKLTRCRKAIDTLAPPAGQIYRKVRDWRNTRKYVQTQWGFSFAGDPGLASGEWEIHEINAFLNLFETHDSVIDIGANVGFYSCLAASRRKHVIAIEPAQASLTVLYKNLCKNNFTDVEVIPVGLSRQSGLGRLYGFGTIASFVHGWGHASDARYSIVPLSTLDTLFSGRLKNEKLLIKMDVEGFELDVLAGAVETLTRNPKPTWLIELLLHDHVIPGGICRDFQKAFDRFWEHGYECRMLNAKQSLVDPADVTRWISNKVVDSNTNDFVFSIA